MENIRLEEVGGKTCIFYDDKWGDSVTVMKSYVETGNSLPLTEVELFKLAKFLRADRIEKFFKEEV